MVEIISRSNQIQTQENLNVSSIKPKDGHSVVQQQEPATSVSEHKSSRNFLMRIIDKVVSLFHKKEDIEISNPKNLYPTDPADKKSDAFRIVDLWGFVKGSMQENAPEHYNQDKLDKFAKLLKQETLDGFFADISVQIDSGKIHKDIQQIMLKEYIDAPSVKEEGTKHAIEGILSSFKEEELVEFVQNCIKEGREKSQLPEPIQKRYDDIMRHAVVTPSVHQSPSQRSNKVPDFKTFNDSLPKEFQIK